MAATIDLRLRRKVRQRFKLKQISPDKVRLVIHRSGKHTYAQVVDPSGNTLASASTLSKVSEKLKNGTNLEAARFVGQAVAKEAIKKGVKDVAFDRSGFLYHGRVKALADAAREIGLVF